MIPSMWDFRTIGKRSKACVFCLINMEGTYIQEFLSSTRMFQRWWYIQCGIFVSLESGTRHVSFAESIWRDFVSVVCFESPSLGHKYVSGKYLQYFLNWKLIGVHLWSPDTVDSRNFVTYFSCIQSSKQNSYWKTIAKFAIVHLEPNAVKITNLFCWINMKEIFVRVACIDSQSQCDNGCDRSWGTNSHIPRTYRPRQHPHFAAALHTFVNKLLKQTYTVYVTWRKCHVTLFNSFILLFIWPIEFTSLKNNSFIWLTLVRPETMYEYHYIDIMAGWRKKKQSLKRNIMEYWNFVIRLRRLVEKQTTKTIISTK